ncbi:PREDICTED: alpha-taxilin-like [Amphimedon queenslandica]|uniref:Alpha-taxilin n=1 Tax=Amphimedon queenslandica TaxID=400682 RepID=A0A1X7TJE2_AMPQE|nr:PREDICTED: alpha-taxilin-like [Amphimedon queenslandica]|eukprot:XP_019859265.1 PREDICTED: alpha-taxilin-like [Amphimedon queenslandica]
MAATTSVSPSIEESSERPTASTAAAPSSKDKKKFSLKDELSDIRKVMDQLDLSTESKLDALYKHCMTIVRDYKRLDKRLTECQRKQQEVIQHRDIIQTECNRATAAKNKLESLCRELQKRNKEVMEESRVQAREEEEKRREIAEKFQTTIDDITERMQEHHDRNVSLKQENADLVGKLKKLIEQYEAREKLLSEMMEKQKKCDDLSMQEMELKGQLSIYSEKFEEFQSTLTKSNEVFSTFKKEMDKMAKTIGELEKESNTWKLKYEKCNRSLLEMADERIQHVETVKVLKTKNDKLEKLCRALQTERTDLSQKLKNLEVQDKEECLGSEDKPETTPPDVTPIETQNED